jgi:hypothetical protein
MSLLHPTVRIIWVTRPGEPDAEIGESLGQRVVLLNPELDTEQIAPVLARVSAWLLRDARGSKSNGVPSHIEPVLIQG